MSRSVPIPFAVAAGGRLVVAHDEGVRRGLACDCRCPECHELVIARQGEARAWGFAHQSGSQCPGAYESSLHLAVKEIIFAARKLLVPPCIVRRHHAPSPDVYQYCSPSPRETIREFDARFPRDGIGEMEERVIEFEEVTLERPDTDVRPDIVGIAAGERLYVEVAVTHFVDGAKRLKLRQRGVPTIELDLSHKHGIPWTRAELQRYLLSESDGKDWLFHPAAEVLAAHDHQRRSLAEDERLRALVAPVRRVFQTQEVSTHRPLAQIRADYRAGGPTSAADREAVIRKFFAR
jgi:competence protein CoiA